jgi:hypothetical protein
MFMAAPPYASEAGVLGRPRGEIGTLGGPPTGDTDRVRSGTRERHAGHNGAIATPSTVWQDGLLVDYRAGSSWCADESAVGWLRGLPVAVVGGGRAAVVSRWAFRSPVTVGVAPNPWTLSPGTLYRRSVAARVTSFACPRLSSSRGGAEVCR